jgi:hypothetical protein
MKTLFSIILFLIFVSPAISQDSSATFNNLGYFTYTLTHTLDTLDVTLGSPTFGKFNNYEITVTSTGVDTIYVQVICADGTTWAQQALQSMASGSNVTSISATTTTVTYRLLDPQPKKIRLIVPDAAASVATIIEGKYQRP